MNINLHLTGAAPDAEPVACRKPYESAPFVWAPGAAPCCQVRDEHEDAYRVAGDGAKRETGHDTVRAPAVCLTCHAVIGELVVTMSTIFGLEEDDRMTGPSARWRVY